MNSKTFLARVEAYHEAGWRLALINATTIVGAPTPVHGAAAPAHGAVAAVTANPDQAPSAEAPCVFEIAWAFAKDLEFETIREQISSTDKVPSISEFFGAAFLYENEIRELFGIDVTGLGLDLGGQLYKTATKVPFSHAAIKARLAAREAASVAPSAPAVAPSAPGQTA
jgi:ech hydrogenase subunit D